MLGRPVPVAARRHAFLVLAWLGVASAALANPIETLQSVEQGAQMGDAAFSDDGENLYAASPTELVAFSRDPATGVLAFLGAPAFAGADDVAVSPDGAHVYVARGDAIHTFARDGATGALPDTPASTRDLDPSAGPCSLAIAPDGAFAYAACRGANAVLALAREAASGALGAPAPFPAAGGPRDLALDPDGDHLYVACSDDDTLRSYARDAGTGALTALAAYSEGVGGVSGLNEAHGVVVTPDGGGVYAIGSDPTRGTIAVFSRDAGSGALAFVERNGPTADFPATRIAASDDVVWLSSQQEAIGAERQDLFAYTRNLATNRLTLADRVVTNREPPFGTGGLALDPSGEQVVVTGSALGLTVTRVVPDTPLLQRTQNLNQGQGGVTGLAGARAVLAAPDHRHIIVVTGDPDAITSFSRNPTTGALSFAETHADGLGNPLAIVSSPLGDFLYLADSETGLVRYARSETGALTHEGAVTDGLAGAGARALAIAPGGAHVYAMGAGTGGIARYGRDATTGALTYLDTKTISSIGNASVGLEVSADGRFVNTRLNGLVVVARDPATGALGAAFPATLPSGPLALAFPRDGAHAYSLGAACGATCALTFTGHARNAQTGAVGTTVENITTPVVDSDRFPATGILASPDGRFVYLYGGNAVVAFARDRATGELALADAESGTTTAVTTSPDGARVYVAAATGQLRVYAPEPSACALAAVATLALAARRSRAAG
jgi:6-phosphogluconolactonase (cycloisomerase 2 family)